ncbi:hypothetical protein [Streptomyces sp. NPDC091215]|uniref:hypothetical protein n=1 Tax=Streptomyces sp. NPDC091215 TaxID=3155192 RepID=UPI003448D98F
MPLPAGVDGVTVSSGKPLCLPDGTPFEGKLLFIGPDLVTVGAQDVILAGTTEVDLVDGQFSVTLAANDVAGMSPSGWTYRVIGHFGNAPSWIRYISLPKATPSVVLADVLVPDLVAGTFTVLKDPNTIGNVVVTGTPTAGQVPTATSGSAASWQTPPGGGGGSTTKTATVRVTDDNLIGLPSAPSWAIVQTSGNTKLQCTIAASVGDRIRVCGACIHIGSHFLDWALLDSGGSIALYATTGTSTAPAEGNPTMYTSNSFLPVQSPDMFTVASGHINAGQATVALVHQGLGTGGGNLVYAHPTYPFRLRLENLGPEPS